MITERTFEELLKNGPNDNFIDGSGIIWKFKEMKRNKPVYDKCWIVGDKEYPYTEDYNELTALVNPKEFIDAPDLGGKLTMFRVFIDYNYPLLFVVRNPTGQLFMFTETEDTNLFEGWGVVPISRDDYDNILKSKISFYNVYQKHSHEFLKIFHFYKSDRIMVSPLPMSGDDCPGDTYYNNIPGVKG